MLVVPNEWPTKRRRLEVLFGLFVFFASFRSSTAADCRFLYDCFSCASAMDGILPCHWCVSTGTCGNSLQQLGCSSFMRVEFAYNCPLSPRTEFAYVDVFARSRALPFISAANAKTPQMMNDCLAANIPGVVIRRSFEVPCDPVCSFCLGYVAYSPNDNAVVLTFRSTNSDQQLLLEALHFIFYAQKDFYPVGGKVVAYFHDAFYALWNTGLEREFENALQAYPNAEVWVFGHSLGGSLASLAAAFIARMRLVDANRLKFVSFGQPRTGDLTYAMIFDALVPHKYRVVHQGDFITKTPFRLPLFNQISFTHHRFEVFYPNEMTASDAYIVCPRAEDAVCSESVPDSLDFSNHRHYFNTSLSEWPKVGCLAPLSGANYPAIQPVQSFGNQIDGGYVQTTRG
ncbi:Lipase, class 3 family-containing protein [Aphelenchoides fujianensis]|nr:Lipase, class 3 family-containing protein [Aphelenchoides fujianensis]